MLTTSLGLIVKGSFVGRRNLGLVVVGTESREDSVVEADGRARGNWRLELVSNGEGLRKPETGLGVVTSTTTSSTTSISFSSPSWLPSTISDATISSGTSVVSGWSVVSGTSSVSSSFAASTFLFRLGKAKRRELENRLLLPPLLERLPLGKPLGRRRLLKPPKVLRGPALTMTRLDEDSTPAKPETGVGLTMPLGWNELRGRKIGFG